MQPIRRDSPKGMPCYEWLRVFLRTDYVGDMISMTINPSAAGRLDDDATMTVFTRKSRRDIGHEYLVELPPRAAQIALSTSLNANEDILTVSRPSGAEYPPDGTPSALNGVATAFAEWRVEHQEQICESSTPFSIDLRQPFASFLFRDGVRERLRYMRGEDIRVFHNTRRKNGGPFRLYGIVDATDDHGHLLVRSQEYQPYSSPIGELEWEPRYEESANDPGDRIRWAHFWATDDECDVFFLMRADGTFEEVAIRHGDRTPFGRYVHRRHKGYEFSGFAPAEDGVTNHRVLSCSGEFGLRVKIRRT